MANMGVKEVQEGFLAGAPLIKQEIQDKSVQIPNFLIDNYQKEPWPLGEGTQMQEITFRSNLPQTERGLAAWKKLGNVQGCDPGPAPGCGYNWTKFGGYGLERKVIELMERDFRTEEYCINEIQTTKQFKQVFSKIVQNIYRQTEYFKEQNIGLNFFSMLSKKYLVDGGGAKHNPQNPYVYRTVGSTKLSTLNIAMLEFFYENMRRLPDAIPLDVVDGQPIYGLVASHQLLSRLYRDDSNLREDVKFSGAANDNLMKYNFMSTIRGMFLAVPHLYPRRFVVQSNELVEVLPFLSDMPAEVGSFADINPAYEAATHEEVLIMGKDPMKIYYLESETSLGNGAEFGSQPSLMESWKWINPLTTEDPLQKVGFYVTSAKIGLSAEHSEGLFGIVVERPSVALMAMYTPNPVAPVAAPSITNILADMGCPCPAILSVSAHPITAGSYFIQFATAVTGDPDDEVIFEMDSGATVTGTIVELSSDGLAGEFTFPATFTSDQFKNVIGVFCENNMSCSARVMSASDCRAGQTGAVKLVLDRAIKADTANDVIVAYFGDCSEINLKVVSVDGPNLEWTVGYATGTGPTDNPTGTGSPTAVQLNEDMICDRGGIIKVCVPTATDASCPGCSAPTATACS